jgi:archaellum biogenesis ATPase FlaH
MISEKRILGTSLKSRNYFEKIQAFELLSSLSDQGQIIYKEIESYYEKDKEAQSCEAEVIEERLANKNPKLAEVYKAIIKSLGDVSPDNLIQDVLEVKRNDLGQRLATALISGKSRADIPALMEEYTNLSEESISRGHSEASVLSGDNLYSFIDSYDAGNRIKLYPKSLNELLKGGVFRGTHIVVFGRPEIGKSTFLKNLTFGFLWQKLRVLYVGNEDPAAMHIMRMLVRLTGLTEEQIRANKEQAMSIAESRNFNNFYYAGLEPGTLKEVESLVEDIKPDVLIVDQIRNLKINEQNYVLQLEKAARGIRTITQKHNLVGISVTQAGDSAAHKDILEMGDIDYSNTGIPGACDLILGFGCKETDFETNYRVISLPKNKISGIKNPLRVSFNPVLARIE